MSAFYAWLNGNWFSLLQSVGIVGGLIFTALSLRGDTRSRKVGYLLALKEEHRVLWSEMHNRPELGRVMAEEIDLVKCPITVAEERFLNLVIVHFHTGWQLAIAGAAHSLDVMAADVRGFFTLPLPLIVWNQSKGNRDPKFVSFVEGCCRG